MIIKQIVVCLFNQLIVCCLLLLLLLLVYSLSVARRLLFFTCYFKVCFLTLLFCFFFFVTHHTHHTSHHSYYYYFSPSGRRQLAGWITLRCQDRSPLRAAWFYCGSSPLVVSSPVQRVMPGYPARLLFHCAWKRQG